MSAPRILIYCQFLLGIGHVHRCAAITRALAEHFDVHLILGGAPLQHISFGGATLHQLAPLRSADSSFSGLAHLDGSPFTETDQNRRRESLISLVDALNADALIIETYPFGRRAMRFELGPLLNWARTQQPRPLTVCSVRDILQRRKAHRERESVEIVSQHFDKVWVHADPDAIRLEESFPDAHRIADKLHYTGYVAPPQPTPARRRDGILVSAGGGAAGHQLMLAVNNLIRSGYRADTQWTITTGPHLDRDTSRLLQETQRSRRLQVHPYIPELCQQLSRRALSISMAGYNTALDVLQSGVASVMVPFEDNGETEQRQRAEWLARRGRVVHLRSDELDNTTLAAAIDRALGTAVPELNLRVDGAQTARRHITQWLGRPGGARG